MTHDMEQLTGVLGATKEKEKWDCPYCNASFDDHRKKTMHCRMTHPEKPIPHLSPEQQLARKREYNRRNRMRNIKKGLTGAGKARTRSKGTGYVPHSLTKQYKRETYLRQKARYKAAGLTSQGRIPAASSRRKMSMAQQARRRRELLNGISAPQEQPQPIDPMGEAAKAIIVAAQVLRSVSVGLKL